MAKNKLKVGVLYGGRSTEHEVSLRSAASVFKRLDRTLFEVVAIYIDREGSWHWVSMPGDFMQSSVNAMPQAKSDPEVVFLPRPQVGVDGQSKAVFVHQSQAHFGRREEVDVVIPMLHGQNCEDGRLQGLLDSAGVPYTGSGVLGSAIGMDKEISKRLAQMAGIPIVPYRVVRSWDSAAHLEAVIQETEKSFGYPIFVKATREGSSVGVYKVKARSEFLPAIQKAFGYDNKVLIEKGVAAREIEFSALQNLDRSQRPLISIPAEIIPTHEFYTYDAKYNDENGAVFKIPAEISPELRSKMSKMAQDIFIALELEGYARIDLFLDKNTNEFFFNEVNTLPGFTSISMFPRLFEESGIPYTELLTKLVELAVAKRSVSTDSKN
jgi:D-alanine-D-alanine ligase